MLTALFALAGCSEGFPVPDPSSVVSLVIEPAELTVYTSPEGGSITDFELMSRRVDGSLVELEEAEWTLSNRTVGEIDETGEFEASVDNGGVANVLARFAGIEAQALVTVVFVDVIASEGIDVAAFDVPRIAHPGLWTYPPNGVNLPRNTPSLSFQWADVGATAARIRFRSAVTDLTVYAAGTSWTADEATWASLVGTNAGGSVEVELSLLVGTEVWSEEVITVNVNRFDARGAIYYWSTSAYGIRRIAYGSQAEDFLTAATTGYCVGCHSVRGDRIGYTFDGGNGAFGLRNIGSGTDVIHHESGVFGNFNTISPDESRVLVALQGSLLLYDAGTGALIGEVATGGWATHPDWSPDGTQVAFVMTNGDGVDWSFTGGRIMVMDVYADGSFGSPVAIIDPVDPYNAYYPAWSPDGEWLVYNVSTGDSYADPDAMVWVAKADGSVAVELTAASVVTGLTNSLPRWAPLPDDDVLWLAFSSNRVYGNVTLGNPQLWVSGFDPVRAAAGVDPSWPAFWLPGQDPAQNNHIPMWAE